MRTILTTASMLLAGALLACTPVPDENATYIQADLADTGGDMATGLGYGMGGDMSKATMSIGLSTDTVPAGQVVFEVTNSSESLEHEMVVSRLPANGALLPYDENDAEVDEHKLGELGEAEDLGPGESKRLVITLDPGQYILYCNIPGHYMAGMWTILTVTG